MFGAPYRTDGMYDEGVLVGAAPWGKHELVPIRLNTGFSWYPGATHGLSNTTWNGRYYSPWGQIFIGTGNTTSSVRLQVRNSHAMYLGADDIWRHFRGDIKNWKMEGYFADTYFANVGGNNAVRDESANGGGWSVSLASLVNNPSAATWHYWLQPFYPRSAIVAGTKAVFQAQQVRLITDIDGDPAADSTRFIASFASDSYSSATGDTPPIPAYMQPRMKRVRDQWIWLTGHAFVAWANTGVYGPDNFLANPPSTV